VETDDKQVLVFLPEMAFGVNAAGIDVHITPVTAPPPLPSHTTLAGNIYLISATPGPPPTVPPPAPGLTSSSCPSPGPTGQEPPAGQPNLAVPAQVLFRIPPVAYNSVQLRYDGAWHKLQYFGQPDYVNVGIDHLGEVAGFEERSSGAPPQRQSNFPTLILEITLTVVALGIVLVGVLAQRRRASGA
jgi:hypothetical protein